MRSRLRWWTHTRLGAGLLAAVLACVFLAAMYVGLTRSTAPSVDRYCMYGAVSDAQLQGCEGHVTQSQIKALDTNAAKFARGEIGSCRADAGPFCEGAP